MEKNKKWLRNEVNELPIRFVGFSMLKQREEFTVSKDDVLELIDQLDEPEVLTQEWIDENEEQEEMYGSYGVPVHKLQNLLVPKQEIMEVPQEWLDVIKRNKDMSLETILRIANPNREEEERFVKTWLTYSGIEVEEEQKYILSINITDKASKTNYETFLNKRGIFHSMDNESFNSEEFNWSEEEIKGLEDGEILFEHFAVKVEELEE